MSSSYYYTTRNPLSAPPSVSDHNNNHDRPQTVPSSSSQNENTVLDHHQHPDISVILHQKVVERSSSNNKKQKNNATTKSLLAHHGPLLKCQNAIIHNNVTLLKKTLLQHDNENQTMIGELFTASNVNQDTGELTFEASPSPPNRILPQQEDHDDANEKEGRFSPSPTTALGLASQVHHQTQHPHPSTRFFHETANKTTLLHLAVESSGTKISSNDHHNTTRQGRNYQHHYSPTLNKTTRIAFNNNRNVTEIIEELIFMGSPIWKRNSEGLTCCHLAMKHCPHLIVPLFFRYGRDNDTTHQHESREAVLEEVKSFLRDVVAYEDDYEETIVGKFSPYRVDVVHGLLTLFEDDLDTLLAPDGNGKTPIDILADNKFHLPALQRNQIMKLLLSSLPSEETPMMTVANSNNDDIDDGEDENNNNNNNSNSSSSSSKQLTPFSTAGIFFVHPITRLMIIVLLIALHFVLFLGDFYTRVSNRADNDMIVTASNNFNNNNNNSFINSKFTVSAESADLPFVVNVARLLGSSWISISDDIVNADNVSEEEKSIRVELLITRILCIVLGFVLVGLFFAFPLHWFLRDFCKLRIFGAEIVLGGGGDTNNFNTPSQNEDDENDDEKREEENFSPATLRLFRESISQTYQPYSDPVTDISDGPLQRYFTRKAVLDVSSSSSSSSKSSISVEETQIKPIINSRNRLLLFFIGAYIGLYCASYVHDTVVDKYIISDAGTGGDSSNNFSSTSVTWYPLTLTSSSYHMFSMHLFHTSLYCLVILFVSIFDTMTQAIDAGPLYLGSILNTHGYIPSRRWMKFATLVWAKHRVWMTILLNLLLVGGLIVFHYFDIVNDGALLPMYSSNSSMNLYHIFVLLAFSTCCVLLDWIMLSQEWNLPNLQSVSLVVSSSSIEESFNGGEKNNNQESSDDNNNNEKKQQENEGTQTTPNSSHTSSSLLEAENSFSLPCLSTKRFGNVFSFIFFFWIVNLAIDLCRVFWYLSASIDYLQALTSNDLVEWYHPLCFVGAILPLVFAVIFFIVFLIRNSTRIKIQSAFLASSSSSSSSGSFTCCTCCSDVCCSCRTGGRGGQNRCSNILLQCCKSDSDSMILSTSSGVRTDLVTRGKNKDRMFFAVRGGRGYNNNNSDEEMLAMMSQEHKDREGPKRLRNVLMSGRSSSKATSHQSQGGAEEEQIKIDETKEEISRRPDENEQDDTNTYVEVSEPSVMVSESRNDQESPPVELTDEQRQAVENMNAILDSLRKPQTKDQQEQTTAATANTNENNNNNNNVPTTSSNDEQRQLSPQSQISSNHHQEERLYHRPASPTSSTRGQQLHLHEHQHQQRHQEHHDHNNYHEHQQHYRDQQEPENNNQVPLRHLDPTLIMYNDGEQPHHQDRTTTNHNSYHHSHHHHNHHQEQGQEREQEEPPQQRFQERYQHEYNSTVRKPATSSSIRERQPQQSSEQQRPFYSPQEINFIDQTSQHHKDDYYERRRQELKQEREKSGLNSEQQGKYYNSKPYQQFAAPRTSSALLSNEMTITRENEFILRGADDPQYYSVWEMALQNRVEALRLALIRDPSLVSYLGGPGLRCIERDPEDGRQIIHSCSYQQQARVDLQRREGLLGHPSQLMKNKEYEEDERNNKNHHRIIPHPNEKQQVEEVYFAPSRDGKPQTLQRVEAKRRKRILQQQQQQKDTYYESTNDGDNEEELSSLADSEKIEYDNFDVTTTTNNDNREELRVKFATADENDENHQNRNRTNKTRHPTKERPHWVISLLADEHQVEKAIREDHEARGGHGELIDYGATLLHYAIYANCPSIIALLISNGANPLDRTMSGQLTCIDLANIMGRWTVARRLENFALSLQKI